MIRSQSRVAISGSTNKTGGLKLRQNKIGKSESTNINNKLKLNSNIKNIQYSTPATQKLKPRPLQTKTNIINSERTSNKLVSEDVNKTGVNLSIKKTLQSDSLGSAKLKPLSKVHKSDENDETAFPQSYNPLDDQCQFDEKLCQKILELQLADDGLPIFKSTEPFDF